MKRFMMIAILMLAVVISGCTKKESTAPQADNTAPAVQADNSLTAITERGTFVLGFDDSFPPMGFKQDGAYVGFDLDLAKEVTKRMGVELVLQPILWDVKEQELNTRQIDCIWNGFTMTPEREAALTFTKPYMSNKQIIVVLADSSINTLADLTGKTVALQRNSSASDALNKFPEVRASLEQLLEFDDNLMAMTDLDAKSSDAVVMDIVVANYNYLKKSPGKYRILDETLSDEFFGVGFRKNDVALKDKVEAILLEMAADGTMAEISNNWFGADITILK
jgi:polar amino acid transport system substrate-binding protein